MGRPAAAAAACPRRRGAPAGAAVERVTVRQGPLALGPLRGALHLANTRDVRAPGLDGWLVRMHARVVDRRGRPLPVSR